MKNELREQSSLAAKVAAIQKMSTKTLLELWPKLYGTDAPKLNKRLLRQRLAFRVQELELGSLSEKHKGRLQRLQKPSAKDKPVPKARVNKPPAGTRITKEYEDETHEVIVTKEGFEYRGQIYRSLSGIAKLITGSHWSGPVFFGLKGSSHGQK
ncbi:DUF2924 domain-containing protein [Endozoicomonas arenosclerae]|uniref:DUF2924 domain-containing protein n=1 Tax=Endozoicomonas arenosclerae TaxID=1633495 RepID=UPI000781BDAB|nr:DUF2924 domain-containing protein [Endozoicomonas arenosclerae]